jgi:hypothetical protein
MGRHALLNLAPIRLVDLITVRIPRDPLAREEPAQIGMLELGGESALRTAATGTIR